MGYGLNPGVKAFLDIYGVHSYARYISKNAYVYRVTISWKQG